MLPRTDDNCILMMHKASSKASDLNVYHMVEMSTIFLDTMQYDNPSNGLILVIDLKEVTSLMKFFNEFNKNFVNIRLESCILLGFVTLL